MILEKIFLSWWVIQFLEKLWKMCENVKLATTEKWRSYEVSEPTYRTKKIFTENLLLIEMKKKTEIIYE